MFAAARMERDPHRRPVPLPALPSLRCMSAWDGWGLGGEAWVSEIRPREGARGGLCGNSLKRLESNATAPQRRKPGQHQKPGTNMRGGAEPIAAAFVPAGALKKQNRSVVLSLPLLLLPLGFRSGLELPAPSVLDSGAATNCCHSPCKLQEAL